MPFDGMTRNGQQRRHLIIRQAMKLRLLKYSNTDNLGDVIQTLAVSQHVVDHAGYIDRDFLSTYDGEECAVVLNGWFSHEPQNWPPSPAITPIFFGFHISAEAKPFYEKHKGYFKRFEPIGCRDRGTAEILQGWGVDAYVSGCATMTFSQRASAPADPKTIVVDVSRHLFNRQDRAQFVHLEQRMPVFWRLVPQEAKIETAKALLKLYRDEAGQVITSRIHSALPCFAMGIPTVYCGVVEYRTSVVDDVGIATHQLSSYRRQRVTSLPFRTPDFREKKQEMANDLRSRLADLGVGLSDWAP